MIVASVEFPVEVSIGTTNPTQINDIDLPIIVNISINLGSNRKYGHS